MTTDPKSGAEYRTFNADGWRTAALGYSDLAIAQTWVARAITEMTEAFLDTFATGREAQECPKSPEPIAVEPRTAPGGSPVTPQP